MKPIPLSLVTKISIIFSILGILLLVLGISIGSITGLIMIVLGWIVLIGTIIFKAIFYRCPHCKHFLKIPYHNHYCPHCGKRLD